MRRIVSDNMNDVFIVECSDKMNVIITDFLTNKIVKKYRSKRIIVGKTPRQLARGYARASNAPIILDLGRGQYVFIGAEIIKFKTNAPIKYFYAPLGPSRSVYSYAIDENGSYYLMSEHMIVHNMPAKTIDPYDVYYSGKVVLDKVKLRYSTIVKWQV